jgi:hypothetical protein
VADLIEATFPVCEEAVRMSGLGLAQIDDVILVGGVTKMPYVRERAAQFFGRPPRTDVNPDEAVALGRRPGGVAGAIPAPTWVDPGRLTGPRWSRRPPRPARSRRRPPRPR